MNFERDGHATAVVRIISHEAYRFVPIPCLVLRPCIQEVALKQYEQRHLQEYLKARNVNLNVFVTRCLHHNT